MKAVAVLLALLVGVQCAAGYTGFIRTSSEKFVDDNCQEFVPLGMNTYGFYIKHSVVKSRSVCKHSLPASHTNVNVGP